ncbi:hypothetical protein V492_08041 [Pseudogymnoascus sp. VKM F-4246]|nr:hypothetical protein V492_08041 [Pseudogymnoascus sp. VKM F-4246]
MERTISSRRGRGYGPGAVAFKHWGSDEELVRGLGIGVDADLRPDSGASIARPAPVAEPGGGVDRNWRFPSQRRSDESDVETVGDYDPRHVPSTRQDDNFFDAHASAYFAAGERSWAGAVEARVDDDDDEDEVAEAPQRVAV